MPRKQIIKILNSDIPGITATGLTKAEISVNITDKKFFIGNTLGIPENLSPRFSYISKTRYDVTTTGITVPANAWLLEIIGCGGGGGGGGGAAINHLTTANTPVGGVGGQGGQGGRIVFRIDDLNLVPGSSQIGITIGSGGIGGQGRTLLGSATIASGYRGETGGFTTVYDSNTGKDIIIFPGGQGGVSTTTSLNYIQRAHRSGFCGKISGHGGPPGTRSASSPAWAGANSKYGGGGGGGGGSIIAGSASKNAPGRGGSPDIWYTFPSDTTLGGFTGVAVSGLLDGGQGLTSQYGGGGGGGGWAYKPFTDSFGFTAGNGGTGAVGGGGGGGGGSCGSTASNLGDATYWSGAGGKGGDGYVILTWY